MTIASLIANLDRLKERALGGAAAGLDTEASRITRDMKATTAHGDVTSATRRSYNARRVGHGETGGTAHDTSVAAVELYNPGHVSTAPVDIEGLGVIIDSATDYQEDLETENAGEKAVLGPTITAEYRNLTIAAAAGSKRALGG